MKKYYLQSKVSTGTTIFPKYNGLENDIEKRVDCTFEYEGLHIKQWDFTFAQGTFGDAWIVSGEIEANSSTDAINIYLKKQNDILSRIFFCVPVWHSYGFHRSLLISNDEFHTGFYFMRVESKGTGLVITPEILSSIKNQDFTNIPKKFFSFYTEYINATTALGGLSLGCIALESILPHGKDARIVILGEDLYYRIFSNDKNIGRKQGFRNRIFHGIYFNDGDSTEKDYSDLLEAIKLALLSKNENIKDIFSLQEAFKYIPRQKTRIDGYGGIYLKSNNNYILNIKNLANSDNKLFHEFQRNIQDQYGIETDIHVKIENY